MTKDAMLQILKTEFARAYAEWQESESLLANANDNDYIHIEAINRCAIREFQECETIARITKKLFNVTFEEFADIV